MGFTTGPWTFSRSSSPDEAVAFGYFVSVWGRREGGGWKVLLDIGTSNSKPGPEVERLHLGPLSRRGGKADRARAHDSFVNAELHLGQDLQRSGILEAYRSVAAEACRFYREGHAPSIGFESARAILGTTPAVPRYTLIALHESASGDLAYAYGRYDFPPAPGPAGYYLRIWNRTSPGSPTLALDLLSPIPNE